MYSNCKRLCKGSENSMQPSFYKLFLVPHHFGWVILESVKPFSSESLLTDTGRVRQKWLNLLKTNALYNPK